MEIFPRFTPRVIVALAFLAIILAMIIIAARAAPTLREQAIVQNTHPVRVIDSTATTSS
jgi:hypothetical protein